jgi:hypothetical protein
MEGPAVHLLASIQNQFVQLDSPLHRVADAIQEGIHAVIDPHDQSGSDATTVDGALARGPAPSAAQVRGATLEVPGTIDHDRARADAGRTLAAIDWSKPDISLWVPATGSHAIPSQWRDAVAASPDAARTSLALVDYPAGADFNDSVSTGMETLRLVLAGIAEHGGTHRVSLAGHSQGAWVIGDAIQTPELGRMVDKAVLYGHPAPARVDWSRGADANVRQVDHADDPFTWDLAGGSDALRAISDLSHGGSIATYGTIAATALANPGFAAYLIGAHLLHARPGSEHDPHHYQSQYTDGAAFLTA